MRKVEFKNNILADAKTNAVAIGQTPCEKLPMIESMDYNLYYRTGSGQGANLIDWNPTGCRDARHKVYQNLDEFKAAIPFESHGTGIDNQAISGLFVNAAKHDYHLSRNAPAIHAGEPLPDTIAQALCWKTGVAVSMGALQPEPLSLLEPGESFALNAGGSTVTVGDQLYYTDAAYTPEGMLRHYAGVEIEKTEADILFTDERYERFAYTLPVHNGWYNLTLRFAELFFNEPGQRQFNVLVEGQKVIEALDIYSLVGRNTALDSTFGVEVVDGELNIEFQAIAGKNNPQLCALLLTRCASSEEASAFSASLRAGFQEKAIRTESSVSVYPNPGKESIHIRYQASEGGPMRVVMADITNRQWFTKSQLVTSGQNAFSISTSELPGGRILSHAATSQPANGKESSNRKITDVLLLNQIARTYLRRAVFLICSIRGEGCNNCGFP